MGKIKLGIFCSGTYFLKDKQKAKETKVWTKLFPEKQIIKIQVWNQCSTT